MSKKTAHRLLLLLFISVFSLDFFASRFPEFIGSVNVAIVSPFVLFSYLSFMQKMYDETVPHLIALPKIAGELSFTYLKDLRIIQQTPWERRFQGAKVPVEIQGIIWENRGKMKTEPMEIR